MKITVCSIQNVPRPKSYKPHSFWADTLWNFYASKESCLKLTPDVGEYKNLESLAATVRGAARRMGIRVTVYSYRDGVYVVKKEAIK